MESALSEGVSFSGITLAVAAPEGDSLPALLEEFIPKMKDVNQYCDVVAMSREDALRAMERGEVTAVLVMPENFAQGIMNGTNPDVELIVPADRPLEAMLTLWVGQSATDILASVQSGVYAVLDVYQQNPPADLSYGNVVSQINMRYVRWTLGRQGMFREMPVEVTAQLAIDVHYGLSLLAYLVLSLAPLFMPAFDGDYLRSQLRYRAAGRGTVGFYLGALFGCWILLLPLMILVPLLLTGGSFAATLWTGALCALFCAAFGSLCCLLTANTGSCGVVSFFSSLVFLFLSGGILPPVLLPRTMQKLLACSPVTWLRNALAMGVEGYEVFWGHIAALVVAAAAMIFLGAVLYCRRAQQGEETV